MYQKKSKVFKLEMADNNRLKIPKELFDESKLHHVPVFVVDSDNYYHKDGMFNYENHNQPPDGIIYSENKFESDGDYISAFVSLFDDKEIIGEFINYEITPTKYETIDGIMVVEEFNIGAVYIK